MTTKTKVKVASEDIPENVTLVKKRSQAEVKPKKQKTTKTNS